MTLPPPQKKKSHGTEGVTVSSEIGDTLPICRAQQYVFTVAKVASFFQLETTLKSFQTFKIFIMNTIFNFFTHLISQNSRLVTCPVAG